MKKRSKQKTRRRLYRVAKIIITTIMLLSSFMIGFGIGINNIPESQTNPPKDGKYNINIHEGGKVVITTKIQYVHTDNNKLVIYGEPIHEPIE